MKENDRGFIWEILGVVIFIIYWLYEIISYVVSLISDNGWPAAILIVFIVIPLIILVIALIRAK